MHFFLATGVQENTAEPVYRWPPSIKHRPVALEGHQKTKDEFSESCCLIISFFRQEKKREKSKNLHLLSKKQGRRGIMLFCMVEGVVARVEVDGLLVRIKN